MRLSRDGQPCILEVSESDLAEGGAFEPAPAPA
jgi:hypothetical protein